MKRGQGSLEYLLILAAILAIAVVVVLVANSLLSAPAGQTQVQEGEYACAISGIELRGYDSVYAGAASIVETGPSAITFTDNFGREQTVEFNGGASVTIPNPDAYGETACTLSGLDHDYTLYVNKNNLALYLEGSLLSFTPNSLLSPLQIETLTNGLIDGTQLTYEETVEINEEIEEIIEQDGFLETGEEFNAEVVENYLNESIDGQLDETVVQDIVDTLPENSPAIAGLNPSFGVQFLISENQTASLPQNIELTLVNVAASSLPGQLSEVTIKLGDGVLHVIAMGSSKQIGDIVVEVAGLSPTDDTATLIVTLEPVVNPSVSQDRVFGQLGSNTLVLDGSITNGIYGSDIIVSESFEVNSYVTLFSDDVGGAYFQTTSGSTGIVYKLDFSDGLYLSDEPIPHEIIISIFGNDYVLNKITPSEEMYLTNVETEEQLVLIEGDSFPGYDLWKVKFMSAGEPGSQMLDYFSVYLNKNYNRKDQVSEISGPFNHFSVGYDIEDGTGNPLMVLNLGDDSLSEVREWELDGTANHVLSGAESSFIYGVPFEAREIIEVGPNVILDTDETNGPYLTQTSTSSGIVYKIDFVENFPSVPAVLTSEAVIPFLGENYVINSISMDELVLTKQGTSEQLILVDGYTFPGYDLWKTKIILVPVEEDYEIDDVRVYLNKNYPKRDRVSEIIGPNEYFVVRGTTDPAIQIELL